MVVLGPTGSGKTALSLALAERFGGEIVNCDSVAMYREFEIGTAKPTAAERARAPHHLLDFVDPCGYVTAGDYARQAREILQQVRQRGAMPIVVGGTGLYLRALLEGLFAGPQRSEDLRERLRERVEESGQAICTGSCAVSIQLRPQRFMPMTHPSCCGPLRSAWPRDKNERNVEARQGAATGISHRAVGTQSQPQGVV